MISSYPLAQVHGEPAQPTYRDQYFAGMALAEYPYHSNPLQKLAEVGYDQAFMNVYHQLKSRVR